MRQNIILQKRNSQMLNAFVGIRKSIGKNFVFCLMVLPMFSFIVVFNYIPMYGIQLAFKNYVYDLGITKSPWIGFENFRFLLTSADLMEILRNTVLYNLVFMFLGTFICICVALLLFEITNKLVVKTYQTVMFFPYFLSWVVVSLVVYALLDPQFGLLNRILAMVGVPAVDWYTRPELWPFIIVLAVIWKGTGYGSILYYATLIGIDKEYFDSAQIDGANKFQIAVKISLPFLKQVIIIMMLLSLGGLVRSDFGLFFFLPRDIPMLYPTTRTIDTYVFSALKKSSDYGIPTAIGLLQSVIGFILIVVSNAVIRKVDNESSLF